MKLNQFNEISGIVARIQKLEMSRNVIQEASHHKVEMVFDRFRNVIVTVPAHRRDEFRAIALKEIEREHSELVGQLRSLGVELS